MTKKLIFPTFPVTYWDERGEEKETIIVRPVPLSKLEDVRVLQESLIEAYVNLDGCLGSIFSNSGVFSTMKSLAAILPVIGKASPGFEIDPLCDSGDIVQLGQIFFSESITPEMKSLGIKPDAASGRLIYHFPDHRYNPIPSAIARIHDLPFFDKFQQLRDKRIEELTTQMQEKLNLQEAVSAT